MSAAQPTAFSLASLRQAEAQHPHAHIEVVDGRLSLETDDVGYLHTIIVQNLFRLFSAYLAQQPIGQAYIDGVRYILQGDADAAQQARRPDFSFIRQGSAVRLLDLEGDFLGAPDLAVEILSPGQSLPAMMRKLADYLDYGAQEAWLILPRRRELHQYRAHEAEVLVYRADDALRTPLLPDLALPLSEVFAPPIGPAWGAGPGG